MELSILILTHNRPELFKRCLESVLRQLPPSVEVIVNNDSRDIEEIPHPQVRYYYEQFDNISAVYEFLLIIAKKEYVYYLEDDDYLVNDFFDMKLKGDLIAGNYYPAPNTKNWFECIKLYRDCEYTDYNEFTEKLNFEHLQLSQFIFKRRTIRKFCFPMDNNVHNDINLVLYASANASCITTLSKVFYMQTIDGGDNISFPGSLSSVNTVENMDFLNEYKTLRLPNS